MITLLNLKIDFEQFDILDDVEVAVMDKQGLLHTVTGLRFATPPGYTKPVYILDIEQFKDTRKAELDDKIKAKHKELADLNAELKGLNNG